MTRLGPIARTPIGLPFAHLNLRYNPFGELDAAVRSRLAVVPPLQLGTGDVVQVMGDAGRGKTTHLLAWHHNHPGSGYEYVPEGSNRLTTRSPPAVFLVDEADRLTAKELERLFRSVDRLVLATHSDLSGRCPRAVRTIVLSGLELEQLAQILARRLEAARRAAGPIPTVRPASLARLRERFGDDLRAIEGHLYEIFQSLEAPCDVEV